MVHGVEDGRVSHTFPDPELDADAAVEEEHGGQRQQEQRHHDEGGVNLTVQQRMPALLTAHVMMIVQEVVLHLKNTDSYRACMTLKMPGTGMGDKTISRYFLVCIETTISMTIIQMHALRDKKTPVSLERSIIFSIFINKKKRG